MEQDRPDVHPKKNLAGLGRNPKPLTGRPARVEYGAFSPHHWVSAERCFMDFWCLDSGSSPRSGGSFKFPLREKGHGACRAILRLSRWDRPRLNSSWNPRAASDSPCGIRSPHPWRWCSSGGPGDRIARSSWLSWSLRKQSSNSVGRRFGSSPRKNHRRFRIRPDCCASHAGFPSSWTPIGG